MTKLVITRGLPASGKTTYARAWVAEDPEHRVRVNRDDLRAMLNESHFIKGVTEQRVMAVRNAAILSLLRKGVSVISDDTSLPQRVARDLRNLAIRADNDCEFEVVDFTHVPLETCLERDAARDKTVGESIIRDHYYRFLRGKELPLPLPEEPEYGELAIEPYVRPEDKPRAVLVDIDGTVASMGLRDPFDQTRVHEDEPKRDVIAVVKALYYVGHEVIFLSARTDSCYDATYKWLLKHIPVPFAQLIMRKEGDFRKDNLVKQELFDQHIRYDYQVTCVLDDRDQVVARWRELGLTCLQVAPGAF